MSFEEYLERCTEPETYRALVTFTGTGASAPVKNYGKGVAITWVSTGIYQITFADPPGNFIGPDGGAGFIATTPSALKGYDATFGVFDSTGKIVQVSITNSTFALADLQVLQSVCLPMIFKRAGTTV